MNDRSSETAKMRPIFATTEAASLKEVSYSKPLSRIQQDWLEKEDTFIAVSAYSGRGTDASQRGSAYG